MKKWTYTCPRCGDGPDCSGAWPSDRSRTEQPSYCLSCGCSLHRIDCAIEPAIPSPLVVALVDVPSRRASGEVVSLLLEQRPPDWEFSEKAKIKIRTPDEQYCVAEVAKSWWGKDLLGKQVRIRMPRTTRCVTLVRL